MLSGRDVAAVTSIEWVRGTVKTCAAKKVCRAAVWKKAGAQAPPPFRTRFAELLPLYEADPDTHAVVIIGELGGTMEEEVAEAMEAKAFTKPLVAFMGGRTAPEGKRMGHAGAIVTGGRGTVKGKTEAIVKAGGKVAKRPSEVGALLKAFLG